MAQLGFIPFLVPAVTAAAPVAQKGYGMARDSISTGGKVASVGVFSSATTTMMRVARSPAFWVVALAGAGALVYYVTKKK